MRRIVPALIIAAVMAVAGACGVPGGSFGMKGPLDEKYRRVDGSPELMEGEEKQWVYMFNSAPSPMQLGIVCMKKEIVWVDIRTDSEKLDGNKKAVFGELRDLSPGDYRLVLTDVKKRNSIVASLEFSVYEKEQEDEEED